MQSNHIYECKESLNHWASRRKADTKSFVLPKQNIRPIMARYDALFSCLDYMENKLNVPFLASKILDVGCASGYGLTPFLLAGFSPEQLHGVDLFGERISQGKAAFPNMNLHQGDATDMNYPSESFDLSMEQFCFCHILSDSTRAKIAQEMLRVTKAGGYILVMDWCVGCRKKQYNGVSKGKIKRLFHVGDKTEIVKRWPVQLAPPIGRTLSLYAPSFYPIIKKLFPLVLSHLTLLQKH